MDTDTFNIAARMDADGGAVEPRLHSAALTVTLLDVELQNR